MVIAAALQSKAAAEVFSHLRLTWHMRIVQSEPAGTSVQQAYFQDLFYTIWFFFP